MLYQFLQSKCDSSKTYIPMHKNCQSQNAYMCVFGIWCFSSFGYVAKVIYCNCSWFNMHLLHFNDFKVCVCVCMDWYRLGKTDSKFSSFSFHFLTFIRITLFFTHFLSLFSSFKPTKWFSHREKKTICIWFGLFRSNTFTSNFRTILCAHFCRFYFSLLSCCIFFSSFIRPFVENLT